MFKANFSGHNKTGGISSPNAHCGNGLVRDDMYAQPTSSKSSVYLAHRPAVDSCHGRRASLWWRHRERWPGRCCRSCRSRPTRKRRCSSQPRPEKGKSRV